MGFMDDVLKDYKPQKDVGGFDVIKAKGLKCRFNNVSIDDAPPESRYAGSEVFSYELEVIDDPTYEGRRLWANFDLSNEKKVKKLADYMFRLGKQVASRDDLEKVLVDLLDMEVIIRAWGWTPPDRDDEIQLHVIKGLAEDIADNDENWGSEADDSNAKF